LEHDLLKNALAKVDDGDYAPIIETPYTIYHEQHERIADGVGQKLSGGNNRAGEESAMLA